MDVIFMSANLNGVTLQIFTDTTNVTVKIIFNLIVNQIFPVFCAEYDMCVNFGK